MAAGGNHEGHLGAVYAAKGTDEIATLYDRWAESYDAEMAAAGYRHPSICLAMLARHLPAGSAPILDAGAGTGLIGEWLRIMGYPHVEALDISEGMLKVAESKNAYQALQKAALGGSLPFDDARFAGIVSAGVFTTGHVGAEALPGLLEVCRPGGVLVLTVKETVWTSGFEQALDGLASKDAVAKLDDTGPYVSMPGEAGTVPSRCIALRRLSARP